MKIRYTDRTPQDITKQKVQKDWASAIMVLKPFKTGFPTKYIHRDKSYAQVRLVCFQILGEKVIIIIKVRMSRLSWFIDFELLTNY